MDAMSIVEKSIIKWCKKHKSSEAEEKELLNNFAMKMGLLGLVFNGFRDPMKEIMSIKYKGDISKFYREQILNKKIIKEAEGEG